MRRTRTYLPQTLDAARILGLEIAAGRRARRLTQEELAERAATSPSTVRRAERGDTTVALGTMFELAAIVGVRLFDTVTDELPALAARGAERLAVLPARVREPAGAVRDDF